MKKEDSRNSEDILHNLTQTLLYEGYSLYPYRRNAIKNQQPVPFGVVFPAQFYRQNQNAPDFMQTECLVQAEEVNVRIRFLHLLNKAVYKFDPYSFEKGLVPVDHLQLGDRHYEPGWAAVQREVDGENHRLSELREEKRIPFDFQADENVENLLAPNGDPAGRIIHHREKISGEILLKAVPVRNGIHKLTVRIENTSPDRKTPHDRQDALYRSFLSTHMVLQTKSGKFISDQNPPESLESEVNTCENLHTWPILIDQKDEVMLSSPIIIYDYPELSPDSPGDFFDGGEIEEMLVHHVNLIPEEEQERIGQSDEKLKEMLERVKNTTPEQIMKLHGTMKETKP